MGVDPAVGWAVAVGGMRPSRVVDTCPRPGSTCSDALKTTGIWANTIGITEERGTNAAVEDSIYAPGGPRGGGRAARRQQAQQLIEACESQSAQAGEGRGVRAEAASSTLAMKGCIMPPPTRTLNLCAQHPPPPLCPPLASRGAPGAQPATSRQ